MNGAEGETKRRQPDFLAPGLHGAQLLNRDEFGSQAKHKAGERFGGRQESPVSYSLKS